MDSILYIGLDVHKRTVANCIKTVSGHLVRQGAVKAERQVLRQWLSELPGPWMGALEATIFTGWIYDFLKPHALELKVAHPQMLKAITAAKKKDDRVDAEKLANLLRVNLPPECTKMSTELRELRRFLRYRILVVRTAVKTSGVGPLDQQKIFLVATVSNVPDAARQVMSIRPCHVSPLWLLVPCAVSSFRKF